MAWRLKSRWPGNASLGHADRHALGLAIETFAPFDAEMGHGMTGLLTLPSINRR